MGDTHWVRDLMLGDLGDVINAKWRRDPICNPFMKGENVAVVAERDLIVGDPGGRGFEPPQNGWPVNVSCLVDDVVYNEKELQGTVFLYHASIL